jgi:hypothetical protein
MPSRLDTRRRIEGFALLLAFIFTVPPANCKLLRGQIVAKGCMVLPAIRLLNWLHSPHGLGENKLAGVVA